MKILHISTTTKGGAAKAAINLHLNLLEHDIDSKFLFLHGDITGIPHSYLINEKEKGSITKLINIPFLKFNQYKRIKIQRKVKKSGLEGFTSPISSLNIENHKLLQWCDIVQLHWISNYVNLESFFKSIKKPIFWYFHDMNPLLGGLHYSLDIKKINDKSILLLEKKYNKIKDNIFREYSKYLYIITDSLWLKEQVLKSNRFKNTNFIEAVHYFVNEKSYFNIDRTSAKKVLCFSNDSFIILTGADDLSKERKGVKLLSNALKILSSKNVLLLSFGSDHNLNILNKDYSYSNFGFIKSIELLRLIYSAADIFVMPSIQEAFGQTGIEAMACGTPVIGFDNTGMSDFIQHEYNGLLVKNSDENDLASKISSCIENPEFLNKMKKNCRPYVLKHFTKSVQFRNIYKLYNISLKEIELP
jgi:glycosyltransferase involved in cell wall biosynthesis